MATFAAAYLIVWLAVVLYIVRLERRQRSLVRTIQSLRSQLQNPPPRYPGTPGVQGGVSPYVRLSSLTPNAPTSEDFVRTKFQDWVPVAP